MLSWVALSCAVLWRVKVCLFVLSCVTVCEGVLGCVVVGCVNVSFRRAKW